MTTMSVTTTTATLTAFRVRKAVVALAAISAVRSAPYHAERTDEDAGVLEFRAHLDVVEGTGGIRLLLNVRVKEEVILRVD